MFLTLCIQSAVHELIRVSLEVMKHIYIIVIVCVCVCVCVCCVCVCVCVCVCDWVSGEKQAVHTVA